MVTHTHVFEKGDIVWVSFDPSFGHEQKGRRPALIVSSSDFNRSTGMMFVCPISTKDKKYIHHLALNETTTKGFVMCEHLRSMDYKSRNIEFIERASRVLMINVLHCLQAVLEN